MASHNYKLYLYFIIARASRALSNIASDYAVNKLRKYDFLPGQSGCHSLPSPTASPELPLCFLSYFSSSSFAFSCLPHPVASAVGHVRIMLVMAALPSPLAYPIVVVLPVGGGRAKVLVLAFIGAGPQQQRWACRACAAVEPVFVFFNLLHGESDVN